MCVFIICDGSCSLGILSRVFLGTGIETCFNYFILRHAENDKQQL